MDRKKDVEQALEQLGLQKDETLKAIEAKHQLEEELKQLKAEKDRRDNQVYFKGSV